MSNAELLTRIAQILYNEDPMKINLGCNHDEYEPEASTIIQRLPSAQNEADALEIVHDEFSRWFGGEDLAGPKEKYRAASALIWATWLQHTHSQNPSATAQRYLRDKRE